MMLKGDRRTATECQKLEDVRESAIRLKQNRSKAVKQEAGSKTQAKPKQESTSRPDQRHTTPFQTRDQTSKEPPITPQNGGSL